MYKTALIVSGVLAFLALAMPDLVTLGLFMLILPGLILALAPTVFVYLALTGIIHRFAPLPGGAIGWIVSALLAAGIGWVVMQPIRAAETIRWRAQIKPEVIPPTPLRLSGDVLLDFPPQPGNKRTTGACNYLCAALLDTPGVTGVIVADGINRKRLRLVPRGTAPDAGIRPVDPQNILNLFDKLDMQRRGRGSPRLFKETDALREAIKAQWTLRLNTEQTLVADPIGKEARPEWTVQSVSQTERGAPSVERLEIRDARGEVRLRRSLVKHSIPWKFFAFEYYGGIENARFRVARETLSTGARYADFDPALELLKHAVIKRPNAPADAKETLRKAVVAALDDPNSGAEQLLAARDWLKQLAYSMSDEDRPLVLRIAQDKRVADVAPLLRDLLRDPVPAEFRDAFVARIVDPRTSADDRLYFALRLARMPIGTFASPTEAERRIWTDPRLYSDAAPFLERLADTGEPGLRQLIALLREAVLIDAWWQRRPIVREIRRGFARMGKDAAPAIAVVLPIMRDNPSALMNVWQERQEWDKTLVLIGLPPEQLPMPENFTPDQAARERRDAAQAASAYDPDKRDGYNY